MDVASKRTHFRLSPKRRKQLDDEAERRGVSISELLCAIVDLHVRAVGDEVLGWTDGDTCVIQIHQPPIVQTTVHIRHCYTRAARGVSR